VLAMLVERDREPDARGTEVVAVEDDAEVVAVAMFGVMVIFTKIKKLTYR
jgi:hypothetical protein